MNINQDGRYGLDIGTSSLGDLGYVEWLKILVCITYTYSGNSN